MMRPPSSDEGAVLKNASSRQRLMTARVMNVISRHRLLTRFSKRTAGLRSTARASGRKRDEGPSSDGEVGFRNVTAAFANEGLA